MNPPKYPATRPTVTPASTPIAVVKKPTNSEMRAPYRIRMSRSRPVPSVPSQKPLVPGPTGLPAASSPVVGYRDEHGRGEGERDHDHDHRQGYHGHLVLPQPPPGQLPLAASLDFRRD